MLLATLLGLESLPVQRFSSFFIAEFFRQLAAKRPEKLRVARGCPLESKLDLCVEGLKEAGEFLLRKSPIPVFPRAVEPGSNWGTADADSVG
jgi:hypothetical protein